MKLVAPVTNTFITCSFVSKLAQHRMVKRLSDELFTFLPEGLRRVRVERIGPHAFADTADGYVLRDQLPDVAVFAIAAADFVSGSDNTGPYRCCGSLRNGLPLKGRLALGGKLLGHLIDHALNANRVDIASQFGVYDSGMHSGSTHAAVTVPLVESNSEKDIRRLRSAIGDEWVIRRAFKVEIVEVNIGEAVASRRQIDEAASFANKRGDEVDQEKVTEMICAELRFEAVHRLAERCGHNARIGDHHVKGFLFCQQLIGADAHTFEAGEIEFNELETATAGCRCLSHFRGCRFTLGQIARRTYNVRAVGGKRPRGLHAEAGRNA